MKSFTFLVFTIVASCVVCDELEFSEDTKTINLSSNGLQSLTIDFSAYTELEEIDLSENDLIMIESDAFKENSKLKRIDLSGNRKLSLPMGMFLETNATFVNLSDCNVEEIPEGALDGMPNLDVLDLSENPIQYVESLGFESMKTPPKKFIISKITQDELSLVCKHIDTIFFVRDEGKEYECKNIRTKSPITVKALKPEKSYTNDQDVDIQIIEEQLIKGDTHLEMLSDDPTVEGSGNDPEEITEPKINATEKTEEVTAEPPKEVPQIDASKPDESVHEEEVKPDDSVLEEEEAVPEPTTSPIAPKDEHKHLEAPLAAPKEEQKHDEAPKEEHTHHEVPKEEHKHEEAPKEEHKHEEAANDEHKRKANTNDLILLGRADKGRSKMSPPKENLMVDPKTRKSEADSSEDPSAEKAEAKTSSGSSIVLVMIIGVVVVGSAIVGYKYYKDRKPSYSAVNGHPKENPTEGKELKEIKVEKANNEPQCERIPLMEPRVPEIEFKEIVEDQADGKEITAKEAIGGEDKADIPNIDDDVSAKSVEGAEK